MRDFVIFTGPSLAAGERIPHRRFDWRPPAAQGDILRAVRAGARAIGLIDGYFEGVPAVLHKEILFALHAGVHVLGAASMGALRAAELHAYGMRGIGRVFDWYVSGLIDADDEVAVLHAPAELGHVALSVPLVNVRATIEAMVDAQALDHAMAAALLDAARALHFKERNWLRISELAGVTSASAPSAAALAAHAVDQKTCDALALVEAMALLAEAWPGPFRADFVFERTDAWDACAGCDDIADDGDRLIGREYFFRRKNSHE